MMGKANVNRFIKGCQAFRRLNGTSVQRVSEV